MAYDAPAADRRQFITWSAGGAFMLALAEPVLAQQGRGGGAPPAGGAPAGRGGAPGGAAPNQSPWFTVGQNGRVTVWSTAVEMGQGSHTGQAAIIADQLDVPWAMIDVHMVDLSKYGNNISTGGSNTIRSTFQRAKDAGATARTQFMQAAATRWGVPIDQVTTAGGKVVNKTTKAELGYAELAAAAGALPTPTNVAYRDATADGNQCIGAPQETKRLRERVTGQEIYGIDVRVPNMDRATVVQAPVFGATLTSVDEAPAMAIAGVKKVLKVPNAQGQITSVAVVAKDTFTAFKGMRALKPVWSAPPQTSTSADLSTQLAAAHTATLAAEPSAAAAPLRAAYNSAAKKVETSYELSHINHVTMEPQNATAHVTDGKVEIWAPTQVPSQVKGGAARWAGKPTAEVVLHTTMLGGGFGRRLSADYVELAVRIAAMHDAPVQMVWTREEDFAHDTYRRAVRQTYRAGLRPDGLIDGFEIISAATDAPVGNDGTQLPPYNTIKSIVHTPAGTGGRVTAGIPQGFWRSVDPGITTWGRESFIDECAIAAGQDPFEYRMKLLGDNTRVKALLQKVADTIDYKKARPAGTAVGVAVAAGFGSFTAHAVEVEVKNKNITVKRIVVASDLGVVVAPNQVTAQFEGGSLMGLSAALVEAQTFTGGKADHVQFGQYNVLRNRQAPKVEVFLTPNVDGAAVGGSGEPPIPTLAPALANAVFKATGQRVRKLPFASQGFTA